MFACIKFRIFTICSVCNGLSRSFGQKYARGKPVGGHFVGLREFLKTHLFLGNQVFGYNLLEMLRKAKSIKDQFGFLNFFIESAHN